jgi:hypothetical protein
MQTASLKSIDTLLAHVHVRSGGADEAMLYSQLKHLTLDDARKLVSLYSAPPKPIQVEQR